MLLGGLAHARGLKAIYPELLTPAERGVTPDAAALEAAGLTPVPAVTVGAESSPGESARN
jgi:hypothetical protein